MAHGFRRKGTSYVARLDEDEREVLRSLLGQVHTLLAPEDRAPAADEFEAMMRGAGLTRLGDELGDGLGEGTGEASSAAVADAGAPDPEVADVDPILRRLLPDAHREDPFLAADFRRMAAPGLRARKATGLAAAIAALDRPGEGRRGDELRLGEGEAGQFVVALTDVRLAVGERLELRTDDDADRLEGDLAAGRLNEESAWLVAVYDFLTWLQESLTQAMLEVLPPGGTD